jgi:hypothetical protein
MPDIIHIEPVDPIKWPGLTSFIIERVYQEADERVSVPYTMEEIREMGKRRTNAASSQTDKA